MILYLWYLLRVLWLNTRSTFVMVCKCLGKDVFWMVSLIPTCFFFFFGHFCALPQNCFSEPHILAKLQTSWSLGDDRVCKGIRMYSGQVWQVDDGGQDNVSPLHPHMGSFETQVRCQRGLLYVYFFSLWQGPVSMPHLFDSGDEATAGTDKAEVHVTP